MFRAIGRYFRALGYLLTGRVDQVRRAVSTDPAVVQATFDNIIQEKKKRIGQYKDAVGAMIAQEEKKKSALKRISGEVEKTFLTFSSAEEARFFRSASLGLSFVSSPARTTEVTSSSKALS